MKMLFISQYYPPESGAGAVRSHALTRFLSEQDWKIDVLSELPNYPLGKIYPGYPSGKTVVEYEDGVAIHRVNVLINDRTTNLKKFLQFFSFFFNSISYILRNPKNYDIIYATTPPILSALVGVLASKILDARFVLEVRDLWPDAITGQDGIKKSSLFYRCAKWFERLCYNSADLIIPVTPASEKIINTTCPGKPTEVIWNGVDTDHFSPVAPHPEISAFRSSDNTFIVGYVGIIGFLHDLDNVIKAAEICADDQDIKFVIIGDGVKAEGMRRLIAELELENVHWLGLKEHDEIPAYISALDLGLNPVIDNPIYESIVTVKFFEYLACGTPVLTAGRGYMKTLSNECEAAFMTEPEQPEQLASEIRRLKRLQVKQDESIRRQACSMIATRFDRKIIAKQLSEILKSLTKNEYRT